MKKALVIKGAQGSGKTYLAQSIGMLFNNERVITTTADGVHKLVFGVFDYRLVIVDECHSVLEIKKIHEYLKEKMGRECAFIFITHEPLIIPFKEFQVVTL